MVSAGSTRQILRGLQVPLPGGHSSVSPQHPPVSWLQCVPEASSPWVCGMCMLSTDPGWPHCPSCSQAERREPQCLHLLGDDLGQRSRGCCYSTSPGGWAEALGVEGGGNKTEGSVVQPAWPDAPNKGHRVTPRAAVCTQVRAPGLPALQQLAQCSDDFPLVLQLLQVGGGGLATLQGAA